MSTESASTPAEAVPLVAALSLLERAVGYTRGSLQSVRPELLGNPTPCSEWALRELLDHMVDSLAALQEAADTGRVSLVPASCPPSAVGVVNELRSRASALLGAWTHNDGMQLISVAGSPLTATILVCVGALEITAHGWDVAEACGRDHPIPDELAEDLLALAPFLVQPADRPARFGSPVSVAHDASPGVRLLAELGRQARSCRG
jgi:uncharacterized protein (TIGR03086 family)